MKRRAASTAMSWLPSRRDTEAASPVDTGLTATTRSSTGAPVIIALFIIVVVGTLLRAQGLREQGLLLWDESYYLMEGRYWFHGLRDPEGFVSGRLPGSAPYYGRPFNPLAIAAAMHLVGDTPFAGQLVSLVFGVLTMLLTFCLGAVMLNLRFGLIASALLALLPYHVIYSRTIYPELSSSFFLHAGLLVSILGYRGLIRDVWSAFGSGVLFGLAATASFRTLPIAAVFIVLQGCIGSCLAWFGSRDLRQAIVAGGARVAAAGSGFVLPLFGCQGVFLVFEQYAGLRGLPWTVTPYFQQVFAIADASNDVVARVATDYSFYARALWNYGTPAFTVALVIGLVVSPFLFWRGNRRRLDSACAILVLFTGFVAPFVFYSVLPLSALRYLAIGLSGAALTAAIAIEQLLSWRRAAGIVALIAVLAGEAANGVSNSVWGSGFREAHAFVATRASRVVTTQEGISQYYGPMLAVRFGPLGRPQLRQAWEDGFRYLVVDDQGYVAGPDSGLLRELEAAERPVFAITDRFKTVPLYFLEQDPTLSTFEERMRLFAKLRAESPTPTVRVYRLHRALIDRLTPPSPIKPEIEEEVLINPGFDRLADGFPEAWDRYGKTTIRVGSRKDRPGDRIVCTESGITGGLAQTVPVVPGRRYFLGEWIRSNSERDELARLQVNWNASNGEMVSVDLEVVPALSDQWSIRFVVVTAPPQAAFATIYAAVHGTAAVCFDDMQFAAVPAPGEILPDHTAHAP